MSKILIIGAGRSSSSLIEYLGKNAGEFQWTVTVADHNLALAKRKALLANSPHCEAAHTDINRKEQFGNLIKKHDIVISMAPAYMHAAIARHCLELKKHLITASYVGPKMQALDDQARKNGLLFLNECGLDPGIDHMSAMRVIDRLKSQEFKLLGFETFTGGLLAPVHEDNPWNYKFTWNPRNIVLAGRGCVKFIQKGRYKFIPYHKLFRRTEILNIPQYGYFEGYANRDSLKYLDVYRLKGIQTLYRGTLRRPGFCKAWDTFVQLGATDDSYEMEDVHNMTHRQFINSFLSYNPSDSVELKLAHYLKLELNSEIMFKLKWLGMFDEEPIGLKKGTPAQILEHILKKKWTLGPDEKDIIVMLHKFDYEENGKHKRIQSHMVIEGRDSTHTGMALTVGLPIAIATKLLALGKLTATGVHRPITPELYNPILNELEKVGIQFHEHNENIEPLKLNMI